MNEETFQDIWQSYEGRNLEAEDISQLSNNMIQILLKLQHLKLDGDLLQLLANKKVDLKSDFYTHSIKEILLESQVVMDKSALKKALTITDNNNDKLFSHNIRELSISDVQFYLRQSNLADGKFMKIMNQTMGHKRIIFDNNDINERMLDWMKENSYIDDVTVVSNKLKPVYEGK
ncbi:hypothetical protein [Fructobacillus parabroussonetiae]|uniref:Uncharacterized protein n=1 Tax=Fructobacillus parabroussonetiae TaxID=2713174 RepID=A0ABS5QY26_9LACO|nr:hypothetical protein [Fructobacillus parabroussonetiae]MBS9337520.1 hypothetical protein [Fructobacillus parabroussonetiae]